MPMRQKVTYCIDDLLSLYFHSYFALRLYHICVGPNHVVLNLRCFYLYNQSNISLLISRGGIGENRIICVGTYLE